MTASHPYRQEKRKRKKSNSPRRHQRLPSPSADGDGARAAARMTGGDGGEFRRARGGRERRAAPAAGARREAATGECEGRGRHRAERRDAGEKNETNVEKKRGFCVRNVAVDEFFFFDLITPPPPPTRLRESLVAAPRFPLYPTARRHHRSSSSPSSMLIDDAIPDQNRKEKTGKQDQET